MVQGAKRKGTVLTGALSAAVLATVLMLAPQPALAEELSGQVQEDERTVVVLPEEQSLDVEASDGITQADDQTVKTSSEADATDTEALEGIDVQDQQASADGEGETVDVTDPAEVGAVTDETSPVATGNDAETTLPQESEKPAADESATAPVAEEPAAAEDPFDGKKFVIETGVSNSQVVDVAGGKASKGANVQTGTYSTTSGTQTWRLVPSEQEGFYYVYLDGTDYVLDVKGGKATAGANIQLWTKNGTDAQLWKVNGSTYVSLVTKLNEALGIGVKGGATKAGTNIELAQVSGKAQRYYLLDKNPNVTGGKTIDDGAYYITATGTSIVAETDGGSLSKGANIQAGSKNYSAKQRMYFEYDGEGFYVITVVGTGKVLDVKGGGLVAGTNIQQWTRNNSDAQKWAVVKNADGTYTIVNKATGLVIDIAGGVKSGANLQGYRSNGSAAQKFTFGDSEYLTEGIYMICAESKDSSVIDVVNASSASGAELWLWASNNTLAQRYQVVRLGRNLYRIRTAASGGWLTDTDSGLVQSGSSATAANDNNTWEAVWNGSYYSLRNVATGKVIDLAGGKVVNGTKVQTWNANGTTAQHFLFKSASLLKAGMYEIISLGKNLEVADSSTSAGANMQVGKATKANNQKFYIEAYNGGYRIRNVYSNKVVAVVSSGNNVIQTTASTSKRQVWIPQISDGGTVVFKNAYSGKVLDIQNGTKGTNVQQWNANGSEAQNWALKATNLYGWLRVDGKWQFHYGGGTVKIFSDATHTAWNRIKNYTSKTKYLLTINNSTCRTYVFQGKAGAWEPVYEWLCCVGTTSETDETFGNTARGENFYIRRKGYKMGNYPYEYYWSEFYINSAALNSDGEGQRFHSVLKTGGPNSSDWDGRLGVACTHGCVRLATANAKWIYDNCPINTRVVSY